MNLLFKIMFVISSVYGASCLAEQNFYTEQEKVQDPSVYRHKMKTYLFDIQFIISSESFVLKRIYQDGDDHSVRTCVFESPSALWTLYHCGEIEENSQKPWYLILAGNFSIKDADVHLEYHLERESHIYKNIEYGSLAFTQNPSSMKVDLIDGDLKINVGWSNNRLSFLRTLARVQEEYINKSSSFSSEAVEACFTSGSCTF